MTKSNYTIRYSATFINQFNSILKYFMHQLKNKIAAENFYNVVVKEIEKRSENPENYEKYQSVRKRKNTYYKINIKNYIVFYTVKNKTMELRKILYSKRDINQFI